MHLVSHYLFINFVFLVRYILPLPFAGSSLPLNQMIQPVSFAQNSNTENKISGNLNKVQVIWFNVVCVFVKSIKFLLQLQIYRG